MQMLEGAQTLSVEIWVDCGNLHDQHDTIEELDHRIEAAYCMIFTEKLRKFC